MIRLIWEHLLFFGLVYTWIFSICEEILGYLEVLVKGFYMFFTCYQIITHAEPNSAFSAFGACHLQFSTCHGMMVGAHDKGGR